MAKMIINGEVYSGSTNYASAITYIKEDGTKSTVQKELDSRLVNNNLLINSNFANPVNQRGVTAETWKADKFGLDRWRLITGAKVNSINNNGLELNSLKTDTGLIVQCVEIAEFDMTKSYTLSAYINEKIYSFTADFSKATVGTKKWFQSENLEGGVFLVLNYKPPRNCVEVYIGTNNIGTYTIKWAKLELGEVATPYVSRLYEEELELCQRYYQIIHNNLFPWSATTSDMVFHQHFKPMRITPTISIIEAAVYLDNQKQSGFKFRTDYKTNRRFNLYATKSSHGLKSKAYVGLFLNVALDAEL